MRRFRNDDPFMPWNDPFQDDPSKPWNNPMYENDPFAPWNDPLADERDYRKYCNEQGIPKWNR